MTARAETKRAEVYNMEERFRTPVCSILEDSESYQVLMDLPGVTQDRLEITCENGKISVLGRLENRRYDEYQHWGREACTGSFRREFSLTEQIDAQKIAANLKDGVLKLTLPKAEACKPRRIEISAN